MTRGLPAYLLAIVLLWRAVAAAQDHGQYSQAEIDAGARVYGRQCATCHGPNGNLVPGIDLRNQQFRRGMSDEDLGRTIVNGIPGTGMPPNPLQPAELTGMIAFIRAGFDPSARSVRVGNPVRGKSLAEGKGECLTCHRINGAGPREHHGGERPKKQPHRVHHRQRVPPPR